MIDNGMQRQVQFWIQIIKTLYIFLEFWRKSFVHSPIRACIFCYIIFIEVVPTLQYNLVGKTSNFLDCINDAPRAWNVKQTMACHPLGTNVHRIIVDATAVAVQLIHVSFEQANKTDFLFQNITFLYHNINMHKIQCLHIISYQIHGLRSFSHKVSERIRATMNKCCNAKMQDKQELMLKVDV